MPDAPLKVTGRWQKPPGVRGGRSHRGDRDGRTTQMNDGGFQPYQRRRTTQRHRRSQRGDGRNHREAKMDSATKATEMSEATSQRGVGVPRRDQRRRRTKVGQARPAEHGKGKDMALKGRRKCLTRAREESFQTRSYRPKIAGRSVRLVPCAAPPAPGSTFRRGFRPARTCRRAAYGRQARNARGKRCSRTISGSLAPRASTRLYC